MTVLLHIDDVHVVITTRGVWVIWRLGGVHGPLAPTPLVMGTDAATSYFLYFLILGTVAENQLIQQLVKYQLRGWIQISKLFSVC